VHPFTLLETYDVELVLPICTFAAEIDKFKPGVYMYGEMVI